MSKENISQKTISDFLKKSKKIENQLGIFNIEKQAGQGGTSVVRNASKEGDKQKYVIKFLLENIKDKSKAYKRFKQAHDIISKLESNVILPQLGLFSLDVNEAIEIAYVVMPKAEGTLKDFQKNNDITFETFELIFNRMLVLLKEIHDYKIIHRDLKPDNIFLLSNNIESMVLGDFDIAKFDDELYEKLHKTEGKERLANYLFSAPEQKEKSKKFDEITSSADLYAFGQILHQLLMGETLQGQSKINLSRRDKRFEKYESIIEKLLQHDSDERFQSVGEIEKALNSVFNKIRNNNISCQSGMLLEEIEEKSCFFVYTESYEKALALLKGNDRCCIISGNPGVGKTTLARMLLFNFIKNEKNFEIVEIRNYKEAIDSWKDNVKQIFYFDDFLGKNFRKIQLDRGEDDNIIRLIDHISRCENKYIIFTTREYILNQAKYDYGSLRGKEFDLNKITIDINLYTNKVKAEILYKHLVCTSLSNEYILELLQNNFFLTIISHKNYNPRIIKHLTDEKLLEKPKIPKEKYSNYFLQNLDYPEKIWNDIFEYDEISIEAKILLYVLFIIDTYNSNRLGSGIGDELARNSFNQLYCYYIEYIEFNILVKQEKAFNNALKELENSFIYIKEDPLNDYKQQLKWIITFYDPSINDFLFKYLNENKYILLNISKGLNLFDSFSYDLGNIFNFDNNKDDNRILLTKDLQILLVESIKNKDYLNVQEGFLVDEIISSYGIHVDEDIKNIMKESLKKFELYEKKQAYNDIFHYVNNTEKIYYYYELSKKYKIDKYTPQELYNVASHKDSMGYSITDLYAFSNICNVKNITRHKVNEGDYIHRFLEVFLDNIEDFHILEELLGWLKKYNNEFIFDESDLRSIEDMLYEVLKSESEEKNKNSLKKEKDNIDEKKEIMDMFSALRNNL